MVNRLATSAPTSSTSGMVPLSVWNETPFGLEDRPLAIQDPTGATGAKRALDEHPRVDTAPAGVGLLGHASDVAAREDASEVLNTESCSASPRSTTRSPSSRRRARHHRGHSSPRTVTFSPMLPGAIGWPSVRSALIASSEKRQTARSGPPWSRLRWASPSRPSRRYPRRGHAVLGTPPGETLIWAMRRGRLPRLATRRIIRWTVASSTTRRAGSGRDGGR